jgi:hypothetical protein
MDKPGVTQELRSRSLAHQDSQRRRRLMMTALTIAAIAVAYLVARALT